MYGVYTIYDKIAQEAGPLFEAKNNDVARRSVVSIVSDTINISDYKLLRVGYIDKETCQLVVEPIPLEVDIYPSNEEII